MKKREKLKSQQFRLKIKHLQHDSAGTITGNLPTSVQTQGILKSLFLSSLLLLLLSSLYNSFKFALHKISFISLKAAVNTKNLVTLSRVFCSLLVHLVFIR